MPCSEDLTLEADLRRLVGGYERNVPVQEAAFEIDLCMIARNDGDVEVSWVLGVADYYHLQDLQDGGHAARDTENP